MANKYYSTRVVEVGEQVADFTSKAKMLVIFEDSMVFPELRSFAVLHSGNKLDGVVKPGDVIKIVDSEFKILKVGEDVNNNLKSLGHIVIKFDGGASDLMSGSIHVEDKPIPKVQFGDEISISEGVASAFQGAGKTAIVVGATTESGQAIVKFLRDNGVKIIDEPDIFIKAK